MPVYDRQSSNHQRGHTMLVEIKLFCSRYTEWVLIVRSHCEPWPMMYSIDIEKVNTALCAKALSSTSASTLTGASPAGPTPATNVSPSQSANGTISSSAAPSGTDVNVDNFGANAPRTQWRAGTDDNRHANRGPAFEAVAISMFAVSCFFVLLRYVNLRVRAHQEY